MEQREPFRNNIGFCFLLILSCCTAAEKSSIHFINRDHASIHSSGGILYVNDSIFSGTLFSLDPVQQDTLEIQEYQNGREHGTWKKFATTGALLSQRFFYRGKKEGKFEVWWENGKKKLEYNFKEDEYEGICKEWSEQGVLIRNMSYHNGHEEGLQQMWDATGKIWANYEARNGRHYGMTGVKACATLWENDSVSTH